MEDVDSIDRKVRKREKDRMKRELAGDIADVTEDTILRIEDIFKRKQIKKEETENKKSITRRIFELVMLLGLVLLVVNFVLGNIWLLKTLIKSIIK